MCVCVRVCVFDKHTQGSGNETLMQSRLKKTKQAGRCITVFVNILSVLRIRNSATRIISLWVGIRFSSTTEAIRPPAPSPTPLRRQSVCSACLIPGAAVVTVAERSVLPGRNRSLSHASVRDFLSVLSLFLCELQVFPKIPCRAENVDFPLQKRGSFLPPNVFLLVLRAQLEQSEHEVTVFL